MTDPITTLVDTIDRSSGMLHHRIRVKGSAELATLEGCNLDQSGSFDVVTAEVAGAYRATNPGKVCQRCYPVDAEYATEQGPSE